MRKLTERRSAAAWLAVGILVPMLALGVSGCDRRSDAAAMPEARPVRVATVHVQPAIAQARYPAVIRPRIEADLGFRIAGKVTQRLVSAGARVEEGTPLATLDKADVELAVRAARAQLEAAKADAANTRADFERYAKLRQGDWTTKQEYDRRRTLMEKAEAAVREAESDLNGKINSLDYTTLVADGPGIVTATLIEPGQVVAAGQAAIRVARLGELEAVANIPENRVATLGQATLSVDLWSLPGLVVEGSLRELSPAADSATRTFQAKVTLKNPPPTVQIGMTATVSASLPEVGSVVRLPLASLTQNGTDPAVWVIKPDGKRLELRPVEVAAYSGNELIVKGGLAEGEKVVSAGVHKLDPNQTVRIWAEPQK